MKNDSSEKKDKLQLWFGNKVIKNLLLFLGCWGVRVVGRGEYVQNKNSYQLTYKQVCNLAITSLTMSPSTKVDNMHIICQARTLRLCTWRERQPSNINNSHNNTRTKSDGRITEYTQGSNKSRYSQHCISYTTPLRGLYR